MGWLSRVTRRDHGSAMAPIGARSPGARQPSRLYPARMTTVHLLHAGYAHDRVASSIVLVRDGDALIVVDPGMVARRSLILDPLAHDGDGYHLADPLAADQASILVHRARVLAVADVVIPGHGGPFRIER